MTRLEKVRIIRDHTGHQTVLSLIDWLLDCQIMRMRKSDTPRVRRGLTKVKR